MVLMSQIIIFLVIIISSVTHLSYQSIQDLGDDLAVMEDSNPSMEQLTSSVNQKSLLLCHEQHLKGCGDDNDDDGEIIDNIPSMTQVNKESATSPNRDEVITTIKNRNIHNKNHKNNNNNNNNNNHNNTSSNNKNNNKNTNSDSSSKAQLFTTPAMQADSTTHNKTITNEQHNNHSTSQSNITQMHNSVPLCKSSTSLRNIIFSCFLFLVLLIGLCGNLLAIVVILSSRHLQRQVAYKFIISLAVADMGVSFFVTTMELRSRIHNGDFCDSLNVCYYYTLVNLVFPMASITHLLIIAIDRFCAIVMPYRYSVLFTHSNAKFFIAFTWIYVLFWAAAGMFTWEEPHRIAPLIVPAGQGRYCFYENNLYVTIMSTVIYFIPTLVATCLYCVILWVAMKQANSITRMKQQYMSCNDNTNNNPNNNSTRNNNSTIMNNSNQKKQRRRLKHDLRAARTIALVFAAYTICWLPHFITILITIWDLPAIQRFQQNHKLAYDSIFTTFSAILPPINSCINPFIYFLFGAHFRNAFKDVLYKFLKKPRSGIYSPEECTSHGGSPKIEAKETVVVVAYDFRKKGGGGGGHLSPSTPSISSSNSGINV